jgi:hypothetical protein
MEHEEVDEQEDEDEREQAHPCPPLGVDVSEVG